MPFIIAIKDLMIFARDKKVLLTILIMPLILILIIGSSLSNQFSEESGIKKFIIAVSDKDGGLVSNILINKVLRTSLDNMVDVYYVNETEMAKKVNDKVFPVGIIIPKGFSKGFENNVPLEIQIIALPENELRSNIIKSVLQGFVESVSRSYEEARLVQGVLKENNKTIVRQFQGMSEITEIMIEINSKMAKDGVDFSLTDKQKEARVTSMQYYAVSMMIMFVLFSAITGSRFLLAEREDSTLSRLMVSNVTKFQILLGKFLGIFLLCLISGSAVVLFTNIVYGVDWGSSKFASLLMMLSIAFAASSFGVIISAFGKTSSAAFGMGNAIIQVSTLISGMFPIFGMPDFIKKIAMLTPNYWANDAFYSIMLGANIGGVINNLIILIVIGIIVSSIGLARFRMN